MSKYKNVKKRNIKKRNKKDKNRSPVRKAVLSLILTFAIGVFLISGLKLLSISRTYKEAEDAYTGLQHEVAVVDPAKGYPTIDFDKLLAENPETKAYIYAEGLFSYPIAQAADNEKYLYTLLNGEYNPSGTLFIDYRIPDGIEARNCIIYGHNMNDGSMFAPLYKFSDPDFYEAHRTFHVYTPEHHYLYKVVSVYTADVSSFTYQYEFYDDEEFQNFLQQTVSSSWFSCDTELTAEDKIITLSTCINSYSDSDKRNVVILVRDGEITD